jgi:homoaconitase/3-isopropylmalate dehydratase large subunit
MSLTLFAKLWNDHVITKIDERTSLLQVDRHIVHSQAEPKPHTRRELSLFNFCGVTALAMALNFLMYTTHAKASFM